MELSAGYEWIGGKSQQIENSGWLKSSKNYPSNPPPPLSTQYQAESVRQLGDKATSHTDYDQLELSQWPGRHLATGCAF